MCQATQREVMSVVLKNMETSKFVGQPDGWTDAPELARQFGGAMEALFYCTKHQLRNMEIHGRDFIIPLPIVEHADGDMLAE